MVATVQISVLFLLVLTTIGIVVQANPVPVSEPDADETPETNQQPEKYNKIRLQDVEALTVYQGQMTTFRRTQAVLQMECISGDACKPEYQPRMMQCYNRGHNGNERNVQWECTATLPTEVELGPVNVLCEGFDSPQDIYVLEGSCGVQYNLYYRDRFRWFPRQEDGSGDGTFALFCLVLLGVGYVVNMVFCLWLSSLSWVQAIFASIDSQSAVGGSSDLPPPYDEPVCTCYQSHSEAATVDRNENEGCGITGIVIVDSKDEKAAMKKEQLCYACMGLNKQSKASATGTSSSFWFTLPSPSSSSSSSSSSRSYSSSSWSSSGYGGTSYR